VDNAQYMQAFLDESVENTQVLNRLCLQLEQGDNDDEVFAAMFRAAHTLKGMSATMGFSRMASLTHKLEDVMGFLRETPLLLTENILDQLFSCLDALDNMLDSLRNQGDEGRVDEVGLIRGLSEWMNASAGADHAKSQTLAENKSGSSAERLNESTHPLLEFEMDSTLRHVLHSCQQAGIETGILQVHVDPACVMKGVRAIVVMRAIEEHADCLQCYPDAPLMQEGQYADTIKFAVGLRYANADVVMQAVSNISEILDVTFTSIQDFHDIPSEDAIVQPAPSAMPETFESKAKEPAKKSDVMERTIRVPVDRLDNLMNLLSELVLDKTRLSTLAEQSSVGALRDVSEHISRVSNDLQTAVMALRMMPVESLFQRFPRMVRDLAKSLDKTIRLEMSGLSTEFDRTLIDEMGEVLVHLIRNAADHGLESTEERIRSGKPKEGTIYLSAYASGQNVFIEVADDGGGIHRASILNKAIQNGLVNESAAASLSDEQVYQLLFASGFSTAQTVSDISGRGVGLDAVLRKVESLGGTIQIDSTIQKGSTFRINLPLTLTILQALIVKVGGDLLAIPLSAVEEVVFASETDLQQVHGHQVLNFRDKLVPIFDAGRSLYEQPAMVGDAWHMVVCKEGSRQVALCVDSFLGQQEIVNKPLGRYLKDVSWFSGATILGDGNIALILDVHSCFERIMS